MLQEKKIYVYFDNNLDKRIKVGCLFADFQRGKERFSFEYDDEFFTSFLFRNFFDYDLRPYKARQYLPTGKALFGVFSDTAPDRWGKLLMKRRERVKAEEQKLPKVNTLYETDYLLGVAFHYGERNGACGVPDRRSGRKVRNELRFRRTIGDRKADA